MTDSNSQKKVLLFANTDWYLYNFRLALIQAIAARGAEVVLLSPPGPYVERLQAAGFRWREVPMQRRSLNPLAQLKLLMDLIGLFRDEQPHVVHLFTVKCVGIGGIAARLAGVPLRVNAIAGLGTVYTEDKHRVLRWLVTRVLRVAMGGGRAEMIVQNPDDAALIRRERIADEDHLHLIRGSGVDGRRFNVSLPRPPGATVRVLFAARLLWAKGIDVFMRAAASLADTNAEFRVAGEPDPGNPDSVDQAWLEEAGAAPNVVLLGHVDDMVAELSATDIVVLPSTYGEGVPRILVESAAAALPLLAFDVAGSREIVVDHQNGFLLAAGDEAELFAALRRLVEDRALRDQMSAVSRQHFESEYDQSVVIAKTLAVYE